ncbi:MAG: phosphoribosylamine--glycine ligase N-terminal domain-containing protein, partial [Actinomycetes bacterium]
MDVLVVGAGAREHALCRSLDLDEDVETLYCAPGNAGTASIAENVPVDVTDPRAIASLAESLAVDLVVIGPEVPLVAGAADAVRAAGIACFGPSAQA